MATTNAKTGAGAQPKTGAGAQPKTGAGAQPKTGGAVPNNGTAKPEDKKNVATGVGTNANGAKPAGGAVPTGKTGTDNKAGTTPKADAKPKEEKPVEVRKITWDGKEQDYDPSKKVTFKWPGRTNTDHQRPIAGAFPNKDKKPTAEEITYKGYKITLAKYGSNAVTKIEAIVPQMVDDKPVEKDGKPVVDLVLKVDNVALSSAIDYLQEQLNPGNERPYKWSDIDHVIKFKRGLSSRFSKLDENDNPVKPEKELTEKQKEKEAKKAERDAKRAEKAAAGDKDAKDATVATPPEGLMPKTEGEAKKSEDEKNPEDEKKPEDAPADTPKENSTPTDKTAEDKKEENASAENK